MSCHVVSGGAQKSPGEWSGQNDEVNSRGNWWVGGGETHNRQTESNGSGLWKRKAKHPAMLFRMGRKYKFVSRFSANKGTRQDRGISCSKYFEVHLLRKMISFQGLLLPEIFNLLLGFPHINLLRSANPARAFVQTHSTSGQLDLSAWSSSLSELLALWANK